MKHVLVVGAGAFGGWTALHLLRRGARVTLIDGWGPGHARASSGGETRVIRAIYGPKAIYVSMTADALSQWREHDARTGQRLLRRTGTLWMFGPGVTYGRDALPHLRAAGLPCDELSLTSARRRYPQIDFEGVEDVLFEPEGGYLLARRACESVLNSFIAEGGQYRTGWINSTPIDAGEMTRVLATAGEAHSADAYVFACGPWLGQLFPDAIGDRVMSTRQEIFYFGTPPGDERFSEERFPVWMDFGQQLVYGIPGNVNRGFKVADDTRGPRFDPTLGERMPTADGLRAARTFLTRRFPALKDAPLAGVEVCQYENSPDGDFMIDRHPSAGNARLVGGGSGHGFKMGPSVGRMVAGLVLDGGDADPAFRLSRLKG